MTLAKNHLDGFPVQIEQDLIWGDMDAYGHINNTVYLRYFEDVRIHYWNLIGSTTSEGMALPKDLALIVAKAECKYRRPLVFPSRIMIACRVAHIEGSRMTVDYRIVDLKDGTLAAEGQTLMVCFNLETQQKRSFPEKICERIRQIEGDAKIDLQTTIDLKNVAIAKQ